MESLTEKDLIKIKKIEDNYSVKISLIESKMKSLDDELTKIGKKYNQLRKENISLTSQKNKEISKIKYSKREAKFKNIKFNIGDEFVFDINNGDAYVKLTSSKLFSGSFTFKIIGKTSTQFKIEIINTKSNYDSLDRLYNLYYGSSKLVCYRFHVKKITFKEFALKYNKKVKRRVSIKKI